MHNEDNLPEIRKEIVLKAPIEKVWKAVATSEGLSSWWMENTFTPELGSDFVLKSEQYGDSPCKITELEPPYLLGFDWGKDWHLTFKLSKLDENRTEFTLIHSGWDLDKSTEFGQPHSMIRGHMEKGWENLVTRSLKNYMEG
ncbi:SRPBCC domain-containing protein [Halobacillus rhizosphaerae]|uniref:SRPBCC family protein n=1 Tax=Halobacillus rhizosphaerae TaxID=3064889 RepID=UPI00398A9F7E